MAITLGVCGILSQALMLPLDHIITEDIDINKNDEQQYNNTNYYKNNYDIKIKKKNYWKKTHQKKKMTKI